MPLRDLGTWLARTYLLYTMCWVRVGDFVMVFPDQEKVDAMGRWSPMQGKRPFPRLFLLELCFATWACLFADRVVEMVTTRWLEENSTRLRNLVAKCTREHCFGPIQKDMYAVFIVTLATYLGRHGGGYR